MRCTTSILVLANKQNRRIVGTEKGGGAEQWSGGHITGGGAVYKYQWCPAPAPGGRLQTWSWAGGGLPLTQGTPPTTTSHPPPPTQNILTREHINTVCERHRQRRTDRRSGSPVCFPTSTDPTLRRLTAAVLVITDQFDLLSVCVQTLISKIFLILPVRRSSNSQ